MNIRTLQIADIELPSEMERLRDLAYDLWWSWSPQATRLFAWIDPDHWRRYHNPVQLLINVEPQQWARLLSDAEFRRTYERDWTFFSTDQTLEYLGHTCRGLALPRPVLKRLFHDNAVRWFPGILDGAKSARQLADATPKSRSARVR